MRPGPVWRQFSVSAQKVHFIKPHTLSCHEIVRRSRSIVVLGCLHCGGGLLLAGNLAAVL
jgi:hypothetical protein